MKAIITITGQINGNHKLRNYIQSHEVTSLPFNGYVLHFNSVKDARQAMMQAIKYFKQNDEHCQFVNNSTLLYDASRAEIIKK